MEKVSGHGKKRPTITATWLHAKGIPVFEWPQAMDAALRMSVRPVLPAGRLITTHAALSPLTFFCELGNSRAATSAIAAPKESVRCAHCVIDYGARGILSRPTAAILMEDDKHERGKSKLAAN